jgi:hypothetical protein
MVKNDNELDYLENGVLEEVGPIWKVRGYAQKGADVETGYDILGLCSATKTDGTVKQIAVANGAASSDAYTYNPTTGAWTPHNLSLTTAAKAEFEYFLDGFFMVNYEDATRWNNYTQWYTTTNVTNAPKAKYIKLYLSRLYLAYVVDSGTTYSSRVIFSDLPTGGPPMTIAWDNSVNYFDVDTDDSDVIKGLEVNSNRLLIFKEYSLYRYDTNTLYKIPGAPGTVSQRSIKNIQGWTVYLSHNGIWGYDGETSQLISRQIKDIIEGVATASLAKAAAWVNGDHYYLYLGDINNIRTGLTISNCLIDFDIAKNAYSWRSLRHDPNVFISFADTATDIGYDSATLTYDNAETPYAGALGSERRVYFGDKLGAVYQLDTGTTYDGSDIPFTMETKTYYLGNPSVVKTLHKLHVYCDGGKQVAIQYKLDEKDWVTLGRLTDSHSELLFPFSPSSTRCRKIKFRITESSSGDRFYFEGFDIYFSAEGLVD